MIEKPPRSGAELSPRLESIASLAVDRFEEPTSRPGHLRSLRRAAILALLALATVATTFVLLDQKARLGRPGTSSATAASPRTQAQRFEEEAQGHRRNAARVQSPKLRARILQRANTSAATAAKLRAQAITEELAESR